MWSATTRTIPVRIGKQISLMIFFLLLKKTSNFFCTAAGYTYGSICSDAEDLRCQKCDNPPDFICLQCRGPQGFCGFCFVEEFKRHSKSHFFVITMTKSARQFVLHVLRKHNVLSFLEHEIQ